VLVSGAQLLDPFGDGFVPVEDLPVGHVLHLPIPAARTKVTAFTNVE